MFEHRSFGHHLKLALAGASHATSLRGTLTGFPGGFVVDERELRAFLKRRAPGQDKLSTQRREADVPVFTPSLKGGTTGAPIAFEIRNTDTRPHDYGRGRSIPRPSHADFGQWVEMGTIPTGGGSNSGRLTALICVAGGICLQWLARRGVRVTAEIAAIGGKGAAFEQTIAAARDAGDSVGGIVRCVVTGLQPGLGGALFAGVESELSAALFAIPGVKGVEFGNGFAAAELRGSANNDPFVVRRGVVRTLGNNHGGILGGRTTGMPLEFRVAFKPTPTIYQPIPSVNLADLTAATLEMKGRHDPCIVRRAVPVVEAIAAFVLADLILSDMAARPRLCLTLTGETIEDDLSQYASQRLFVDLVELRVDRLRPKERARARDFPNLVDVPVLLTFRRACDGGVFAGSERVRAAFFRQALRVPAPGTRGFAFVDFEDDFWTDSLVARARKSRVRIVRSRHLFTKKSVARFLARGLPPPIAPDVIEKVAIQPETVDDVIRLLRLGAASATPHVLCAMGSLGTVTRILAGASHSLWTYSSVGGLGALGHLTPAELVRTYRFREGSSVFARYGVTGWPLVFTRSPELHNAAFRREDVDAVMVPLRAPTACEFLALFAALDLRGAAVTYPHKEMIIPLLDELTPAARAIGAVNTVIRRGSRLVGDNTDASGFLAALKDFLGPRFSLRGRKVAVIGAGGAARAVVYALTEAGARVVVFNRTLEKAEALAREFGCGAAHLGSETAARFAAHSQIVVQCAAPGKDPAHFDPLACYPLTGRECVYDLVYEPTLTPTLARAQAAGCRIENGFSMLKAQARLQSAAWLAELKKGEDR